MNHEKNWVNSGKLFRKLETIPSQIPMGSSIGKGVETSG